MNSSAVASRCFLQIYSPSAMHDRYMRVHPAIIYYAVDLNFTLDYSGLVEVRELEQLDVSVLGDRLDVFQITIPYI